jgi:phospholipase/carboxylesterase
MFELTGPSAPPLARGAPRRLVVLLHGYGADGNDLIGLSPMLAPALPDAEFLSPHAPFPCEMGNGGRQWFGFAERAPEAIAAGAELAMRILDDYLDAELAKRDLSEADLALVGFSQGAMMALLVGPRRAHALAAIVGFSGRLLAPERLATEMKSRPPVLLVHGDADPVVPFAALGEAERALKAAGVPVEVVARPRLGHGIDEIGLERAVGFLGQKLGRGGPQARDESFMTRA